MVKYLFTTLPSNDLGLITRSLPVARELVKHGHEILYCSPGPAPRVLISEAGYTNLLPKHPVYHLMMVEHNWHALISHFKSELFRNDFGNIFNFGWQLFRSAPYIMPEITAEIWNMDHISAFSGMMNYNFVRSICSSLMTLIDEAEIDVVVDFWNPMACIAARAVHKPLISIMQADQHPESDGFIWWKPAPDDIPSPVPVINQILSEFNLPAVRSTGEICVGDLTFVVGMPETDPLPPQADVEYIGPLLWQNENAQIPDWIETLEEEKPLIWVYTGNPNYLPRVRTPVDSSVILFVCINAFANENLQVVLTTGHHSIPKSIGPLPSNFYYAPYVPGLAMAEKADLLIHHGGYGSCQTGLFTGTPAVILPTFSERESNARRVAAVGAGEYIMPTETKAWEKHVDAGTLRQTVNKVLSDRSYTINACKIRDRLREYGGEKQVAERIINFTQEQKTIGML